MINKARRWLWDNRKVLIIVALFVGVLELIYFVPFYLIWWVWVLAIILTLGIWWLSGLTREIRKWWLLWLESVWVTTGGLGFILFNLLSNWQFQITVTVIAIIIFAMLRAYEIYLTKDIWPVRAFAFLNFLNILTFFFVSAGLLSAADFYSLSLGVLLMIFAAQVLLAINLRFWREGVTSVRKWLYAVIAVLVIEEILWITSSWHRGVYLKAFLLTIIFYIFADFIMHYNRGSLTVKVAVEYVGLMLLLLVAMFVFDWLFILQ